MEFSEKDLLCFKIFFQSISHFSNSSIEKEVGNKSDFKNKIKDAKYCINNCFSNFKNGSFLIDENTRIEMLYSSLKLISNNENLNSERILFIKNLGLHLGLNAIGTSIMIKQFHADQLLFSVEAAYNCFKVYQN